MGIDQVLVIPTMVIMHLPFARDPEGVDVFCQAYNDFLVDWCGEVPGRLFGAALLPVQDPARTAKEIFRAAELGHPGRADPTDRRPGQVPQRDAPSMMARRRRLRRGVPGVRGDRDGAGHAHLPGAGLPASARRRLPGLPGELFTRAGTDSQTFSFIHEMQVWLAQVLLSGFLDRYPRLEDGHLRVQRRVAPLHPRHLRPPTFKLYANERPGPRRAASVRGLLRAVRDQLRVRRDRRVPPVGAIREHRHLGLGRLPPRRGRLLVGASAT